MNGELAKYIIGKAELVAQSQDIKGLLMSWDVQEVDISRVLGTGVRTNFRNNKIEIDKPFSDYAEDDILSLLFFIVEKLYN